MRFFPTLPCCPLASHLPYADCPFDQSTHQEGMNMKRLTAMAIGLMWLPAVAFAANPAKTYTGTTVENVDQAKQEVSVKTKTGESWTLKVTDPELLKKHNLKKGDQVSIEVDTNNNIITIAKAGESEHSGTDQGANR
jgi:antitoxin component of MazEF toxin-antitoxin module